MEKNISLENFPHVALLCGPNNCNVKLMKKVFDVKMSVRDQIRISGEEDKVEKAEKVISMIRNKLASQHSVTPKEVEQLVWDIASQSIDNTPAAAEIKFLVPPRTPGQRQYMETISKKDVVFSIGPAGTGKTFLAVAMAVADLKEGKVGKIVLVRPAVEAGEKLGFLPGDFQAKINPYLRPLYDALQSLLDFNTLRKYMDKGIIEIAPLAYMRGRTLENAFIILDEAQNTTVSQMKMFLTRLGLKSKVVVTGDITQIDLPRGIYSGLRHAERVLRNIQQIGFVYLNQKDIVRHPLVQKIVTAYESYEKEKEKENFQPKQAEKHREVKL